MSARSLPEAPGGWAGREGRASVNDRQATSLLEDWIHVWDELCDNFGPRGHQNVTHFAACMTTPTGARDCVTVWRYTRRRRRRRMARRSGFQRVGVARRVRLVDRLRTGSWPRIRPVP